MDHKHSPKNIVIGPDKALYENCPVFTKVEAVVMQQGAAVTVQYELRDSAGAPVDLGGLFLVKGADPNAINLRPEKSKCDTIWSVLASLNPHYYAGEDCHDPIEKYFVEVRIQPADEPRNPIWIVPAKVVEPKLGLIQFDVPHKVSSLGGIFVLNVGLCRASDRAPVYIHRGLLSVERSAWRASTVDCKMPTLNDVRMRIMDTDVENLLQGYVEFTTADILDSIVSAIREWNGTSPALANYTFTCFSFPWIEPWLNKIIASLYQKAALRYTRNKLQVAHGGVQGDDLAREQAYTAISMQYQQQWKDWMTVKKKELNLGQFSGTVASPYWRCINSQ